jgi:hypothetical protein
MGPYLAISRRFVAERRNPAPSFSAPDQESPWDDLQVATFAGQAIWNSLAAPFLFARPDFIVQEIDLWSNGGQVWRRLFVTYPDDVNAYSGRHPRPKGRAVPHQAGERHTSPELAGWAREGNGRRVVIIRRKSTPELCKCSQGASPGTGHAPDDRAGSDPAMKTSGQYGFQHRCVLPP